MLKVRDQTTPRETLRALLRTGAEIGGEEVAALGGSAFGEDVDVQCSAQTCDRSLLSIGVFDHSPQAKGTAIMLKMLTVIAALAAFTLTTASTTAARAERSITFSTYYTASQGSCGGVDCCLRGSTEAGSTCVRLEGEGVLSASGGVRVVRLIERRPRDRDAIPLRGMADDRGRTLIEPKYIDLQPLSDVLAWAQKPDGSDVLVDTRGRETPMPFQRLEIMAGGSPSLALLVFGTDDPVSGPQTLHLLGPTGQPTGLVLPSVVGGFSTPGAYVLTIEDGANTVSAVFNGAGQFNGLGNEISRHQSAQWSETTCSHKPYQGLMSVGRSPLSLYPEASLYIPLEEDGRLASLPEGVIGILPVQGKVCTASFVAVQRVGEGYQYRMGSHDAAETLRLFEQLPALTDLRIVNPTSPFASAYFDNNGYAGGQEIFLLARLASTGRWVRSYGDWAFLQLDAIQRFNTVTGDDPLTLANALIEERHAAALANGAAALQRAQEASAMREHRLAQFEREFQSPFGDPQGLINLAAGLGPDFAERVWVKHGSDLLADNLCRAGSPSACSVQNRLNTEGEATFRARDAARAAYRSALAGNGAVPEITVRVLGTGVDSTMPLSEYRRVYGGN